MILQRILELLDVLGECEFLPPGYFYEWARANARRQVCELVDCGLRTGAVFTDWPRAISKVASNVESSR